MKLRHLRYFVAVAEELHFGRAAQRLNMSQPPLSQQIKELEEYLETQLFVRTSRSVELTFAGRKVLERARQIIEDAGELKRVAQRARSGQVGELVVGFISTAGYSILPPLLRHFRETNPDVVVRLRECTGVDQAEQLKRQRIDAGFARDLLPSAAIRSEVILREPFILALPEGHGALSAVRLRLSDLKDDNFVNFPRADAPAYHEAIFRLCLAAGFVPRIAQETTTIHAALVLVRAGVGIAIVPASAMHIQAEGVVFRLPVDTEYRAETVLGWRQGDDSAALTTFIEVARERARAYGKHQERLLSRMNRATWKKGS